MAGSTRISTNLVGIWQIGDTAPPSNDTTDESVVGSSLQEHPVPEGATKLFLAFHDGREWTNNSGMIDVELKWVKGTIFISGYWPPTNAEPPDGMLEQFKSGLRGMFGEYIIPNHEDSGFNLVAIATAFPLGEFPDPTIGWTGGVGFWQVDYPLTSFTFWNLMDRYKPIAVMTTSRNRADKKWVLEIGAKNLARADWSTAFAWNTGRPPYIGGSDIDPAKVWGPNAGHAPQAGDPPDATRPADPVLGAKIGRGITADVNEIQTAIMAKLNAEFAPAELEAVQDAEFQGIPPDHYVSGFAGYHAVWYNDWAASCAAGWHTHVDSGITVANATEAMRLQLQELIAWLNLNIP